MISIIIPTFGDSFDMLKRCIDSVVGHTNVLAGVEIIVVANGCPASVREYVESLEGVPKRLVWFDQPIGFCSAVNEGVEASLGSIVVLLNHDAIILGNGWLNMLLEPFSRSEVGITGPVVGLCSLINREFVLFYCVAIRKKVFNQIGMLDIIYNPGGLDDVDFTVRAEEAGWKVVRVPEWDEIKHGLDGFSGSFPLYHMEHHANWLSEEIFQRNSKVLTDRYKTRKFMDINWPLSQKISEISLVLDFLKKEQIKTILEIGTFMGGTALVWANYVFPGGRVICVDFGKMERYFYTGTDLEKYITNICGDSHEMNTFCKVREVLNGEKVDFLFIDGDHSFEGVKKDFQMYSNFVRIGGLIGFHDILDTEFHRNLAPPNGPVEVCELWDEIKTKYESFELLDPSDDRTFMGIGLIRWDGNLG